MTRPAPCRARTACSRRRRHDAARELLDALLAAPSAVAGRPAPWRCCCAPRRTRGCATPPPPSPTCAAPSRSSRAIRSRTTRWASRLPTLATAAARSPRSGAPSSSIPATRGRGTTSATRCETRGRAGEAQAAFQRAVAVDPDYALAWTNLAAIAREQGDDPAAENAFRRALAAKPDQRSALDRRSPRCCGRAATSTRPRRLYARAGGARPPRRGAAAAARGLPRRARRSRRRARCLWRGARRGVPSSLRAALGERADAADGLPERAARRRRARGATPRASHGWQPRCRELVRGRGFAGVIDDLRWSNFLLAYQGEDDRELQARYAALVASRDRRGRAGSGGAVAATGAAARRRLRDRLRVRVLQRRHRRPVLPALDRRGSTATRFEVFVYHLRLGMIDVASALAARVDHFRRFEGAALAPSAVAPAIRADALDVLVYPGAGHGRDDVRARRIEARAARSARLGPSGDDRARDDRRVLHLRGRWSRRAARALHRAAACALPGIGTLLRAAGGAARRRPRAALGLPADAPLLLCPQSLFKIHPDNDALFARVLAADSAARWCCSRGGIRRSPRGIMRRLAARLRARRRRARRARCACCRSAATRTSCASTRVCDAMLDTLHWSGGNTSLDALACGLPIVTLPRALHARPAERRDAAGWPASPSSSRADEDDVRAASRPARRPRVPARSSCAAHRAGAATRVRRRGAD